MAMAAKFNYQRWIVLVMACVGCFASHAAAQAPRMNYLHHEFMPPGAIGQEQLRRHAGMPGYFQAVEVSVPPGAHVSIVQHGEFSESAPGPVLLGMQLGYVYSLKVSRLPNREGVELFPTIEVINRLFPPEGTKTRFPVPIEISEEDIAQALNGLFVTRIVYLEDPERALPVADDPDHQRSINVAPNEDPLHVADRLGRPMAIIRIGSRIPDENEIISQAPPLQVYPARRPVNPNVQIKDAIERQPQDFPREFLKP